jgi:gluconate 2-dehydrogenase gamma chain
MDRQFDRRKFLFHAGTGLSSAWLSAHWPAVLAASEHSHRAAQSAIPPKFEVLTPEQAVEVDAIAAQIIPTDDTPGAHEAGVVYFIDHALKTFARSQKDLLVEALAQVQTLTKRLFPAVEKFSAASSEEQIAVLKAMEREDNRPAEQRNLPLGVGSAGVTPAGQQPRHATPAQCFGFLRFATVVGFFCDPARGGNKDEVGWKLLGFDSTHVFQPPFGYYDQDYPGWQPNPAEAKAK